MIDRERFTQVRSSSLEPVRSEGYEPVGELSLSDVSECLSLQGSILPDLKQIGKRIGQRYPSAQAPQKGAPFLPMHQCRGILGQVGEEERPDPEELLRRYNLRNSDLGTGPLSELG